MHFSNSCFFPSKYASHGFDWMAFSFLFRVMKNALFLSLLLPRWFQWFGWTTFWLALGNDKCLIGRKLCRMMHKVINVYGFMPKVEVLSKKKNPNFFPQHSEFDKCIRLCPTCMLEEWEKKMTLWILQTFLLFYFQSCCQIRLHWTRRTIQRTILDISAAHRITEDPEEEKMGLDSKQLNN